MTKLNYLNRRSEGVKLGQIVAKDLRKRCRSPSSNSSESKTQPLKDPSPLELHLDGKNLTDQGLAEVARGLEDALGVHGGPRSIKLHSLHLSRNGLTAKSLSELAPSLAKVEEDLEELDLSENKIVVRSRESVEYWTTFLDALKGTSDIKVINLTHNNLSGTGAWESFCRTYLKQFKQNEIRLQQLADEIEDRDSEDKELIQQFSSFKITSSSKNEVQASSCLRGLPSARVIKVLNTSMTDHGALFLSYVLSHHRWIHETLFKHILLFGAAYEGIEYYPNDDLSAFGEKTLKLAEANPYTFSRDIPRVPDNTPAKNGVLDSTYERRVSFGNQRLRNGSVSSTLPSESSKSASSHNCSHAVDDLESLRRKLQRTTLEDRGVQIVQLWSQALKLLAIVRKVLMKPQTRMSALESRAVSSNGSSPDLANPNTNNRSFVIKSLAEYVHKESHEKAHTKSGQNTARMRIPSQSHNGHKHDEEYEKVRHGEEADGSFSPTYASKLVMDNTAGTPTLSLNTITSDRPLTPQIFRHPGQRRGSFSHHSEVSSPTTHTNGAARASVRKAIETNKSRQEIASDFSAKAWELILWYSMDPDRVLSSRQFQSVVAWGSDRNTLLYEAEALGKPTSIQIWRVLEGMGCLVYDGSK